jgi:filamentous hemagglutinin family protein
MTVARKHVSPIRCSTILAIPAVKYFVLVAVFLMSANLVSAQVPPPITPSGLNTQVSGPSNVPGGKVQFDISGGTRPGNGTNLFHSFGQFGVPNNNIANFLNESGQATSNILGRVTGGSPSNIFGTIQTTGFGNANLFLMNPAGILFGPNAMLNVGGSVHFTTADYLRLGDQGSVNSGIFHANPSAPSVLTTAPVTAFGFLGPNPAAITVQGSNLSVPVGQSLSLVAGDVTIQAGTLEDGTVQAAHLSAPGGHINLISVASEGEVLFPSFDLAANVNGQSFSALGTITISDGAIVDVSNDPAGTVLIRGGQLVISGATISADTVDANGAPIAVDIQVTGDVSITAEQGPAITARTTGSGNAGEIRIVSGSMEVTGITEDVLSVIDSHTSGTGNGGNINITTGSLLLTGDPVGLVFPINSGTTGEGTGGNITITAKDVTMEDAFIVSGDALRDGVPGSAGKITIVADGLQMLFSTIEAVGFKGGDITVTVPHIQLQSSGISASSQESQSGAITLNADTLLLGNGSFIDNVTFDAAGGLITISGKVIELSGGSGIFSNTLGNGDAGVISVTATDHLSLIGTSGTVGNGIFSSSGITGGTRGFVGGSGNAGDIFITTPRLALTGGAQINTGTLTSGRGGNVEIEGAEVSMSGQLRQPPREPKFGLSQQVASGIFTVTIGTPSTCAGTCGDGGNVSIRTGSLTMSNGARIDSGTSSTGRGGDITLNASGSVSISGALRDGTPVGIFSRTIGADPGSGSGGTIDLKAFQVSLTDKANISASSTGAGNAGSVTVSTSQLSVLSGGQITTNTQQGGNAGHITVQGLSGAGTFAESVSISGVNTTVSSSSAGPGNGGDITMDAGRVDLTNGAVVSASSTGLGKAGAISITATDQFQMNNGTVTTATAHSDGGNIAIKAGNLVQLRNSEITTNVQGGAGSGGNITIDPQFVILDHSKIIASAIGGNGGNINIVAGVFLISPDSIIDASSTFGISGTITIESPITNLSGTLAPLSGSFLRVAGLVRGCAARMQAGQSSSFVVQSSRDRVPAEPGELSLGPLFARSEASPVARSLNAISSLEAHFAAFPVADKCTS